MALPLPIVSIIVSRCRQQSLIHVWNDRLLMGLRANDTEIITLEAYMSKLVRIKTRNCETKYNLANLWELINMAL